MSQAHTPAEYDLLKRELKALIDMMNWRVRQGCSLGTLSDPEARRARSTLFSYQTGRFPFHLLNEIEQESVKRAMGNYVHGKFDPMKKVFVSNATTMYEAAGEALKVLTPLLEKVCDENDHRQRSLSPGGFVSINVGNSSSVAVATNNSIATNKKENPVKDQQRVALWKSVVVWAAIIGAIGTIAAALITSKS